MLAAYRGVSKGFVYMHRVNIANTDCRAIHGGRWSWCQKGVGRLKSWTAKGNQSVVKVSLRSDIPYHTMSATWNPIRNALKSLVSPPMVVALGVVGTGMWVGHPSYALQRPQGKSSLSSVQARVGVDGADKASLAGSQAAPPLVMHSGAASIPHPDKEYRGGEDAYFIHSSGFCMGVADGVGGWAEIGVDPGLYSRELMGHADSFISGMDSIDQASPQQALEAAHAQTRARGSSTACILCMCGNKVFASNLGDSGFALVREGIVEFVSPQQQHEFNFPYQIGSPDSMSDMPSSAHKLAVEVQKGDTIILATDGLFDNVYPDEAAALVGLSRKNGDPPHVAAEALAKFARTRAADPEYLSPFAYGAQQLGFRYLGGKMDDITVVVAYIEGCAASTNSGDMN